MKYEEVVVLFLNFVDPKLKFCQLHIEHYPGSRNTDSFVRSLEERAYSSYIITGSCMDYGTRSA
jgi:hypothetical protein